MPIIERKPDYAFGRFTEHIRRLVERTLPVPPYIRLRFASSGQLATLSFTKGGGSTPAALPLQTRYGELHFDLRQTLHAHRERRAQFRLRTREYAYRVLSDADPRSQAAIRWEYVSNAPKDGWARHHVQLHRELPLGTGMVDLDAAHLPTGWVTVEEVIRFLIHDLGVVSPATDWPSELADSERQFFESFTSKRYKPPDPGPDP